MDLISTRKLLVSSVFCSPALQVLLLVFYSAQLRTCALRHTEQTFSSLPGANRHHPGLKLTLGSTRKDTVIKGHLKWLVNVSPTTGVTGVAQNTLAGWNHSQKQLIYSVRSLGEWCFTYTSLHRCSVHWKVFRNYIISKGFLLSTCFTVTNPHLFFIWQRVFCYLVKSASHLECVCW